MTAEVFRHVPVFDMADVIGERKGAFIADSKWVDSTHAGNIRADKGFKAIQLIQ